MLGGVWTWGTPHHVATLVVVAVTWWCAQVGDSLAAALPAAAIDTSSSEILELGNVAMAEDSTGGLVYRRKVDGKPHVFASLLRGGAWSAPVRVDVGQPYVSTSPRIAAGLGGRLVVVWAQDGGVNGDRLYSATLDPGALAFESPVPVDLDIGSVGNVDLDVAMNGAGQAYLVYRVITATPADDFTIPPGYVKATLRAARYVASTWSRFDQALNRNNAQPVRQPSPDNAPHVTIDRFGNGAVAFQEPDDEFIDRAWVRRLFGTTFGLPILASPTQYGGQPLRGPVDQIAFDGGQFGNLAVSFRQHPGNPSGLDRTRIFVNLLPDVFASDATKPVGAKPADVAPAAATPVNGAVAISPDQRFQSLFTLAGATRSEGSDILDPQLTDLGVAPTPAGPFAGVDLSKDGRSVSAWIAGSAQSQTVVYREDDDGGSVAGVADTSGLGVGEVKEAFLAGSGYGDAAIAARQVASGQTRIVVARIDGPPSSFAVFEEDKWVRARRPLLEWEPAYDAYGVDRYEITLNKRVMASTAGTKLRFGGRVREGRNTIVVTAIDGLGQRRDSRAILLKADRRPPKVVVRRIGPRRVSVTVNDGRRARSSGVATSTRVEWGDGKRSRVRSRKVHKYRRGGKVTVVVRSADRAGNKRTVRRRIRL
jgi:hypothetical protein